VIECVPEVEL
jgi:hypothetical protein